MSFNLYHICIAYWWLSCIILACVLGMLILSGTKKLGKTVLSLVYFGKCRKDYNFKNWLRIIEVPKRLFWIFYLIASISILFAFIDIVINGQLRYNGNLVLISIGLLLYLTHVLRRLYECLYVSIFSDSNMHILHFLLGITFYPFSVCSQLLSFTLDKKTELNARNMHLLPYGGLFEYCLSPHYFLEIILYFLFVLFYQLSTPMLLCFLFVILNQTIAALSNQSWYRKHFREYSCNRKALIPYIL
uniref:Polyprenal reductase n=1 Tax=Onchocerca volvulus TaxID=6282 RepID=A0A8R1XMH2_ONCVO